MASCARRLSFGSGVEVYERARPSYPVQAVAAAVPGGARRVLDVGAGTGKLTDGLLAAGHEVTAVEPDEVMLARLRSRLPSVRALLGSAESLPLPDGCVDAVVAGQALHWFDLPRALPELARVLVPGGTLAAVWNVRDPAVEWVAELTELVGGSAHWSAYTGQQFDLGSHFGPVTLQTFRWSQDLDVDGLVDLVASRSSALTRPERERASLLAAARELATRVADGEGRVAMPYVTEVHLTSRR